LHNLVIVESPAKAKTIKKILSSYNKAIRWDVVASRGYIKNLPKEYGLDFSSGSISAKWVYEPGKKQFISDLKKKINMYEEIYIATDDDTEGEKIAYDLVEELEISNKYKRVTFGSITEKAIISGINNPRNVSEKKYKIACSRRYVDRDEGYGISDVLRFDFAQKEIQFPNNIGVGRAISPALHLIAEVERDIKNFEPEEYIRVKIRYQKDNCAFEYMSPTRYLINNRDDNISLALFKRKITTNIHQVVSYIPKLEEVAPPEPLYTATLQSSAFYVYGMSGKQTMRLAQELYENGAITYHRTDSNMISDDAYQEIVEYLYDTQNPDDVLDEKRKYKKRKNTEEAHEAIRPSRIIEETAPKNIQTYMLANYDFEMSSEHLKIYELIWFRTLATQMVNAIYDRSVVKIDAGGERFEIHANSLVATTKVINEDDELESVTVNQASGWMKLKGTMLQRSITEEGEEYKNKEVIIPPMSPLDELRVLEISDFRTSTKAPYRYGEGRFTKTIEKLGIARPSTLDSIIPSLENKGLIFRVNGIIFIKKLGMVVDEWVDTYCPWLNSIEGVRAFEEAMEKEENSDDEKVSMLYEYHEKINALKEEIGYLDKENQIRPPSDAQILIAKQLAIKKGLVIKEELYSDASKMSEFIAKHMPSKDKKDGIGTCPACKKGSIVENSKAFGCNKFSDGCKFTIWKESSLALLMKFGINADEDFLKEVIAAAISGSPIFNQNVIVGGKDGAYIDIKKTSKGYSLYFKDQDSSEQ
jgi:DNA topoisomerase-1